MEVKGLGGTNFGVLLLGQGRAGLRSSPLGVGSERRGGVTVVLARICVVVIVAGVVGVIVKG
jgi:hypothetical protein